MYELLDFIFCIKYLLRRCFKAEFHPKPYNISCTSRKIEIYRHAEDINSNKSSPVQLQLL